MKRNTFSHRHAVLTEIGTGREYNRLDGLGEKQGKFRIFNSLLSGSAAVLATSVATRWPVPMRWLIWETWFS
ncbi:MAG: hypothetical protein IPM82_26990 [Saprospiraceae bacterium]|nr:hypothetical protein [Saprospiraceae bacterium]